MYSEIMSIVAHRAATVGISAGMVFGVCAYAADPAAAKAYVLEPQAVWTAGNPAPHAGWVVVVQGQHIIAAGPKESTSIPAGAESVSLTGSTLIPGLMELHSHLLQRPYNEAEEATQILQEEPYYRTLRAGREAGRTLLSGFTTLRDLGTDGVGVACVVGVARRVAVTL